MTAVNRKSIAIQCFLREIARLTGPATQLAVSVYVLFVSTGNSELKLYSRVGQAKYLCAEVGPVHVIEVDYLHWRSGVKL